MAKTRARQVYYKAPLSHSDVPQVVAWWHDPHDQSRARRRARARALTVARLVLQRALEAPPCEGNGLRAFTTHESQTMLLFAEKDHPDLLEAANRALLASARGLATELVLDEAHREMLAML